MRKKITQIIIPPKYEYCALYIVLCTLFFSCDKIDQPFENPLNEITIDTTLKFDTVYSAPNANKRYILMEEFTGHTCPNCPEGAREVQRLDSIHGKQFIPVSIHAGVFAKPKNYPDSSYATDFRTTEGEEYNTEFAIGFYPSAIVSRKEVGGNIVLPKGSWESAVDAMKNDVPKAKIDVMNLYNDSLRILKIKVSTQFISSVSGSYKLQIYLTEDHIIDWQLDGNTHIPNYDHRHVLRKVLNGTWGTQIISSNANDTASFEFSLTINTAWKINDCEVIAFIYNSSTYEVIQANEAKVK